MCLRKVFGAAPKGHPWRRKWHPTLVFLPGKSHRQRRLVGSLGVTERHKLANKHNNNNNKRPLDEASYSHLLRAGPHLGVKPSLPGREEHATGLLCLP